MVIVVIMAMVMVMSSCKKGKTLPLRMKIWSKKSRKALPLMIIHVYLIESLTNPAETSIVADPSLNNVLKIIVSRI